MHTQLLAAFSALALLLSSGVTSAQHPNAPTPARKRITEAVGANRPVIVPGPEELFFKPGPPSLPPGVQFQVIEGDPAKEGQFTMRLKLPDQYRIPPHWHPAIEHVTVLDGTFRIGMGEKFDESRLQDLGPGGFVALPPGHRHFAASNGETTIQLHGIGPWKIHYVNPNDDPRLRGVGGTGGQPGPGSAR